MERMILLSGVVGSTAYGLAGPDSDVDRLGVYAASTRSLLGLYPPKESVVTHDPDVALHEIGKWCRLALQANPNILELVWLTSYDVATAIGRELVSIRRSFLSAKAVRDAYLGFAAGQLHQITRDLDSGDPQRAAKVAKHARHLARVLFQGRGLYETGELVVRLPVLQVSYCRWFGEHTAAGDTSLAQALLDEHRKVFDLSPTPLPAEPDTEVVNAWLFSVRQRLLAVEDAVSVDNRRAV